MSALAYTLETLTGDTTAVVSLLCDNLVNLITMQGILTGVGASESFITTHIFLSSLSGVILGNFVIFFLTYFFLKNKFKSSIPFGIDAPTVFFIGYAMADIYTDQIADGASSDDALKTAWGNASLFILIIGTMKLAFTSFYFIIWKLFKYDIIIALFDERIFGACLFGIGLSLLGMNNLLSIFESPFAGIPALFTLLMVILPYSAYKYNYPNTTQPIIVSKFFEFSPHIFWSLFVGIPLYYSLQVFPDSIDTGAPLPEFFNGFPSLDLAGYYECTDCKSNILGSVTYSVLVFFGGYSVINRALAEISSQNHTDLNEPLLGNTNNTSANNTSANNTSPTFNNTFTSNNRLSNNDVENNSTSQVNPLRRSEENIIPNRDRWNSDDSLLESNDISDKDIIFMFLFLDAFCTIFTGLLGGVIQTTPYIGYSTYRELGAGRNYSMYVALLFLILAGTGGISYFAEAIPKSVLTPIFVLIALNLAQDIFNTPPINSKMIKHNQSIPGYIMAAFPAMANLMAIQGNTSTVVTTLASGFVWTSILWGQATLSIIRGEKLQVLIVFMILAFFTFFGVIHSCNGEVYETPWSQSSYMPTSIFAGYIVTGFLGYVFLPDLPIKEE